MRKIKWFILLGLILFASCHAEVLIGTDEDPPNTPVFEDFKLDNFSSMTDNDVYYNWNAACELVSPWKEVLKQYDDIIKCYNDLSKGWITFFAGQTWYRKNDTAYLYLTYEPDNTIFCELFIDNDEDNEDKDLSRYRVMWGRYDSEVSQGFFILNNGDDSIRVDWKDNSLGYVYDIYYFDSGEVLKVETYWPSYGYWLYGEDTSTIFIDWYQINGKVKSYQYFEDSLWHCWNNDRRDVDCYGYKFH